jgi:formylglycine-generating enzyme required for sulfatase activity
MAYIPAGEFQFGSGRSAEQVKLSAYCMGIFSVTNAEYQAFLKDAGQRRTPSYWKNGTYPEGKGAHPVVYVSLDDAKAYAKWLSERTGFKFFVPTSQQWEHAARGPHNYLYPWGNNQDAYVKDGKLVTKFRYNAVTALSLLSSEPNREVTYDNSKSPYHGKKTTMEKLVAYGKDGRETTFSVSNNGSVRGWVNHDTWTGFIYTDVFHSLTATGGDTSAVGSYEAGKSGYGCYDMAGNVWNWCDTIITATNGAEKGKQVNEIRGGSWYANGNSCKSVSIGEGRAGKGAYNTVGFRIAMDVPER